MSGDPHPPATVLRHLGFDGWSVHHLGGRANIHWLLIRDSSEVVIRCYSRHYSVESAEFERRVLAHMAGRGWAVPIAIGDAIVYEGRTWQAFSRLVGRPRTPRTVTGHRHEQRQRGRLLALLHADLADIGEMDQRQGWLRRDEVLTLHPSIEEVLSRWARRLPEEIAVLHRYAKLAREHLHGLAAPRRPPIVIHGDFATWNLHFKAGQLSGVLDWEFSHVDHRVADFALSWRGHYTEVIAGYEEVSALEPPERALITPYYWLWILEGARDILLNNTGSSKPGLDWNVNTLLRSSPYTHGGV